MKLPKSIHVIFQTQDPLTSVFKITATVTKSEANKYIKFLDELNILIKENDPKKEIIEYQYLKIKVPKKSK